MAAARFCATQPQKFLHNIFMQSFVGRGVVCGFRFYSSQLRATTCCLGAMGPLSSVSLSAVGRHMFCDIMIHVRAGLVGRRYTGILMRPAHPAAIAGSRSASLQSPGMRGMPSQVTLFVVCDLAIAAEAVRWSATFRA